MVNRCLNNPPFTEICASNKPSTVKTLIMRLRPWFRHIVYGIIGATVLSAYFAVKPHLTIEPTRSTNHFLYWRMPANTTVSKGQYITFFQFDPYIIEIQVKHMKRPAIEPLLKRVACMEGESLKVDHHDYYCGDKYLGRARSKTPSGRILSAFNYNGPVPKGKLFVIGDRDASFDSKYFGFIDHGDILAVQKPVF